MAPTSFLGLPTEIRMHVYRYYFDRKPVEIFSTGPKMQNLPTDPFRYVPRFSRNRHSARVCGALILQEARKQTSLSYSLLAVNRFIHEEIFLVQREFNLTLDASDGLELDYSTTAAQFQSAMEFHLLCLTIGSMQCYMLNALFDARKTFRSLQTLIIDATPHRQREDGQLRFIHHVNYCVGPNGSGRCDCQYDVVRRATSLPRCHPDHIPGSWATLIVQQWNWESNHPTESPLEVLFQYPVAPGPLKNSIVADIMPDGGTTIQVKNSAAALIRQEAYTHGILTKYWFDKAKVATEVTATGVQSAGTVPRRTLDQASGAG